MRRGRASNTAQFVALNRALGNLSPQVAGFSDPAAERFLPPRWVKRVERARTRLPKSPLPFWMRGMALFNQFRTAVLDAAILAALPFEQLVVLGAGLDGRAWRLAELASSVVFEVDHPDTQAMKQQRAARLHPVAKEIRFVPVDFGKDDLPSRLREGRFDAGRRTFWLWEGVTIYLAPEDVQKTLAAAAQLSAPRSRLALTYMADTKRPLSTRLFLVAFGVMTGEPMRSTFEAGALQSLARAVGWETLSNTGIDDWKPKLAPDLALTKRQVGLQWDERIWVGRRA